MYLELKKYYCNFFFGTKDPRRAWHVIPGQEVNFVLVLAPLRSSQNPENKFKRCTCHPPPDTSSSTPIREPCQIHCCQSHWNSPQVKSTETRPFSTMRSTIYRHNVHGEKVVIVTAKWSRWKRGRRVSHGTGLMKSNEREKGGEARIEIGSPLGNQRLPFSQPLPLA